MLLLLQTTPPLRHYQLTDITDQPPKVLDDYQSAECLVSDAWREFIFCQPPNVPAVTAITFEAGSPCPKLTGIYAGIDWGVGQWSCYTFSWFGLKPNNVSFSASVPSRTFAFVDPHILVSVDVGSAASGHLKLSSDAGEALEMDLPKGTLKISTGWVKPAKVITISFSQTWLLSLGNLIYQ